MRRVGLMGSRAHTGVDGSTTGRRRGPGAWTLPLLLLAFVAAYPGVALAYPTAARFKDPVLGTGEANGGGALVPGGPARFYTGSPADGHTCSLCHEETPRDSAPPSVFGGQDFRDIEPSIEFEPRSVQFDGYDEGATYIIEIGIPNGVDIAATFEVTDIHGNALGTLALPVATPENPADPATQCTPGRTVAPCPTGTTQMTPDNSTCLVSENTGQPRQVAVVNDCGATKLTVRWVAPSAPTGNERPEPAYFAAAGIDENGTLTNTWRFDRVIPPRGQRPQIPPVEGACALCPGQPASSPWGRGSFFLALVGWLWFRRRASDASAGR